MKIGNNRNKYRKSAGEELSIKWISLIALLVCALIRFALPFDIASILFASAFAVSLVVLLFVFLRFDCEDSKENERNEKIFLISLIVLIASLFGVLIQSYAYKFVEKGFLPFWEISLAVGLTSAVLFVVKILKMSEKGQTGALIFLAFFVALGITAATSSAICTLNYILDENEPERIVATIEDMDSHHHNKAPDSFELVLFLNGETVSIDVSRSVYRKYEIGDEFTFYHYDGAFGKEFYFVGAYKE